MNRKAKRFQPSIILALGSLIFLVFVGYYFLYWVPKQKATLANRYLRVLAMMSDQFEKRGENFPKEIEITIENQNPDEKNSEANKNPVIEGTKKQLQENLKSYFPNTVPEPCLSTWDQKAPQIFYDSLKDSFIFQVKVKPVIPIVRVESLTVNIPVKVSDFIRELSCGEEFDDVLIIDDQGAVICMRSRYMNKGIENSIRALNIKELLNDHSPGVENKKNKDETKAENDPDYTRLKDIEIAGVQYKLFLQPIPLKFLPPEFNSGNSKHLIIAGVLSTDIFSRRCREIPINLLLSFIFLLSVAFITYPMVKILLIGPWERIRIRDVFFLSLFFSIGIPIIVFSILTISHFQVNKVDLKRDFKDLANSIDDRFNNEIQNAYDQLLSIYMQKEKLPLIRPGNATSKELKKNLLDTLIKNDGGITYPYFDMVFIINTQGKQVYKSFGDESLVSFKNVSTRDYFKRIIKKDYWYTTQNQPITLEPVYSMSTARYELNLAIPCAEKGYMAAVMSFRPLSVLNSLIPGDYGFAVIDNDGKVMFHQDRRLNLNENFFSECSVAKRVKAAIFNMASDFIPSILYQGKKRDIYIKPMTNIPWTIIVFRDQGINNSRNMKTLSRSILRYAPYFMILMALLLLYIFIISIQKGVSRIQKKPFYHKTQWIWPNKQLRFKYTYLAFFNLLCFAMLVISIVTTTTPYRPFLYLPLINLILAYLVIRFELTKTGKNNEIKEGEADQNPLLKILKNNILSIIILASTMVILLINDYAGISLVIKIIIIFSFIAICLVLNSVLGEIKKNKNHLFYRHSHPMLVYSFVLLLFVYPPLLLDKISQNEDGIVNMKYHQLTLAYIYSQWLDDVKRDYESQEQVIVKNWGLGANNKFASRLGIYTVSSYQTFIIKDYIHTLEKSHTSQKENKIPQEKEANITEDELNQIRNDLTPIASPIESTFLEKLSEILPMDNSYFEKVKYLYMDISSGQKDYPLKWGYLKPKNGSNNEKTKEIYLKYLDSPYLEYNETKKKVEPVYFISKSLPLKMNLEIASWVWGGILLIALFIFLLFPIVHFIWKAIFLGSLGISLEETVYIGNTVDEIKVLKGRFFIFGNISESIVKWAESEDWAVIGCWKDEKVKSICEHFPLQKKLIIITHLDYMRHNPQANREKLALLEQVVFNCNTTIIVYSQFEPLENFDLSQHSAKKENDKQENGNDYNTSTTVESWKRVLRQFEFKYAKDECSSKESPIVPQLPTNLSKSSVMFVESECSALEYLKPLKTHIFSHIEKIADKNIGDHVIKDIISEHAKPAYDFVWMTSSKEEKLVMIQLAREGLLNFKNRETIRQLLKRKLIKLSPLRLFNITFKDYIDSVEDLGVILKWEATLVDRKWANVRKPFLFLLTGIILFLVISQPNVLSTWLALIPAVTGIIPLLLRLFDQLLGLRIQSD